MKSKIFIITAFVFLLVFASKAKETESRNFQISKNLDIFNSLFRELDMFYVDSIKPEDFVKTSVNKMLEELDPYTNYIPESEKDVLEYMTTGEYAGVGALIGQRDDKIFILEPYENLPAQKNGLKAGDVLIEVDGEKVKGKTVSQVSDLLKGEVGTKVTVLLKRDGEKKLIKKEFLREKIQLNPVDFFEIYDNIAYLHLTSFTDKSSTEVKKVFLDLKVKYKIEGLVLDLRGNPGGIVDEAINICNLFIPKGQEVVSTKGKNQQWDKTYKTLREPIDAEIPIVVLVDGSSASASEIVSGAFQDLDRAVIVGNRTFGKGLVQTTRPVGYGGYLKVTTAKYYTPSGRCIQAIDYEHRNSDGRAERIPDSLTNEFKTARGRVVKDGGGITPDVILEEPKTVDISYRLVSDFYIFDYATAYCEKHPQIDPIDDFVLTDDDYADFKSFLKSKKFTYQLRSSTALKSLREMAKIEGYEDLAKNEFDALELKLVPDTDKDLEALKDQIKQLLSVEIVKRYYYQKGEMKELLKNDKGLKKAIEILKDKNQYKAYLSSKK